MQGSGVPLIAKVDIRTGGVMLQDRLNIPLVGGLMDGGRGCLDFFLGGSTGVGVELQPAATRQPAVKNSRILFVIMRAKRMTAVHLVQP